VNPVACRVTGSHSPGFLPTWILEIIRIHESTTHKQELKRALRNEIANIYREVLRRDLDSSVSCSRPRITNKRGHIQDVKVKVNQSRYRPGVAQRVPGT